MKKIFTYGIVPALAVVFLGAGTVSAAQNMISENFTETHRGGRGLGMGVIKTPQEFVERQTQLFVHQSEITGIPVEEIAGAWAEGKKLETLLKKRELIILWCKKKCAHMERPQMKERLQALVDAGVITQAQAETRLEFMKNTRIDELHEKRSDSEGKFKNDSTCTLKNAIRNVK